MSLHFHKYRFALCGILSIIPFTTLLVSGCGSSGPRERSVDLGKETTLDMILLPNGLWFAKTETTQKQWETVAGENPSRFKGDENPVENVSCGDCESFIAKLNGLAAVEKAGLSFRLPTEEEWEFACRAGATGDYCKLADGTEITKETLGMVGWFGDSPFGSKTHPVGQKQANAFGLYDMIGNVGEWTSTSDGLMRVFRGGCRSDTADNCRASQRLQWSPTSRDSSRGFRLCAEVRPPKNTNRSPGDGLAAFDGMFGEKFGKVLESSLMCETNNTGALACEWEPKNRFRDYSDYVLFATPKTRQVFQMRAVRSMNSQAADDEIAATVSQLESQFGRKAAPLDDETKVILFDGGDYIAVIKKERLFDTTVFVDARCNRLADLATEEAEEIKKSNQDSSKPGASEFDEWFAKFDAQYAQSRKKADEESKPQFDEAERAVSPASRDDSTIQEIISSMVDIPGKEYKMGKTEVTQAQWESVMGTNPSDHRGAKLPVETVSIQDCKKFIARLNGQPDVKKAGLVFRLPTAEEWRFACMAGSGNDSEVDEPEQLAPFAWSIENSDSETHPVGLKRPNNFGLYDMLGNVAEWTSSQEAGFFECYGGSYDLQFFNCTAQKTFEFAEWLEMENVGLRLCADGQVKRSESGKKSLSATDAVRDLASEMVECGGWKSYWVGKFEVTQAKWEAVMGSNPSKYKNPDNPVENVSVDEVLLFIQKINALPANSRKGFSFRLPTSKEWFIACRGGVGEWCKYCSSGGGYPDVTDQTLGTVAWFKDVDFRNRRNNPTKPQPVGKKRPNGWGLYDMLGNVWELSLDEERETFCAYGGCWDHEKPFCDTLDPFPELVLDNADRLENTGFRLWADQKDTEYNDADAESEQDEIARQPFAEKTTPEDSKKMEIAKRAESRAAEASAGIRQSRADEKQKRKTDKKTGKPQPINSLVDNMVQIPGKDYKMGKYEVTQAQWEAIMGQNPSRFKGENNPVEQVSWNDCQEFLSLLNSMPVVKDSGLTFRLPTEEEWEYACRAGASGDYCKLASGTEITKDTLVKVAWFEDNADNTTHPVGQKKPNAWGLYDMHGNVREWTSTAFGGTRVNRGGSWLNSAWGCESSCRSRHSLGDRFVSLGFRLCASGRAD